MAGRTQGMTRRGPVNANEYHEERKRKLVEAGTHVWAFTAQGHLTALRNDPAYLEKKITRQHYTLAEVVEETVSKPVIKSKAVESDDAKPKRGPGRPRKVSPEPEGGE